MNIQFRLASRKVQTFRQITKSVMHLNNSKISVTSLSNNVFQRFTYVRAYLSSNPNKFVHHESLRGKEWMSQSVKLLKSIRIKLWIMAGVVVLTMHHPDIGRMIVFMSSDKWTWGQKLVGPQWTTAARNYHYWQQSSTGIPTNIIYTNNLLSYSRWSLILFTYLVFFILNPKSFK